MEKKNWSVSYPAGMIKYIDFFRQKFFQYEVFDRVINDYIKKYASIPVENICSLGAGTGRHENKLANYGYHIIGLDRNIESIKIAENAVITNKDSVRLLSCDFLKSEVVTEILEKEKILFDCVLMLFIPLSLDDHLKALSIFKKYIKKGGLFITDCFAYDEGFDPHILINNNDFAFDPLSKTPIRERDYCVRMNFYEYNDNIIDWSAVYFYNEDGQLKMQNDHDILDVMSEKEGKERFSHTSDICDMSDLKLLPFHKVTECTKDLTPPNVYEYILGWRKI